MRIIARPAIREFIARHALSASPLNDWYKKASASTADWSNISEIRETFNSCDAIGNDRYVFNIGGNNIRLIAMIHFKRKTLYIRGIYTHEEYTQLSKRGELNTL